MILAADPDRPRHARNPCTTKGHRRMIATTDTKPKRCDNRRADEMGCDVKAGLSGRRCCTRCTHVTHTEGCGPVAA